MSYLDQIEKYLNGELQGDELRRFEERIKTNPRLAEDTELYRELKSFLANNIDDVDELIHSIDEVSRSVHEDEWNRPENAELVANIRRIMMYLGDSIKTEVYHWLKTEAILYPELFDDILQYIDEEKFCRGKLSGDECLTLYERLMQAYGSFTTINSVVDEFLLAKPLPEKTEQQDTLKKANKTTRIIRLPVGRKSPDSVQRRRPGRMLGRIAASIAILIAAGTLLLMVQTKQASTDELYTDFNKTYPVSTVQRSANTAVSNDFSQGLDLYKSGNFARAVASFAGIGEGNAYYVPAKFFTGLSEMESGNYSYAVANFNEVITAGGSNLAADAQWKLALCYLKLGDMEKTRAVLHEIVASNPFYEKDALDLLGKLPG